MIKYSEIISRFMEPLQQFFYFCSNYLHPPERIQTVVCPTEPPTRPVLAG